MSINIDSGGAAFPGEVLDYCESTIFSSEARLVYKKASGMTLRDYFAGQALGEWVRAHIESTVDDLDKKQVARECYSYADAMIKARGKE